jgi:multidrug efflux pump subunit AcrA (membrane-fusion protein)
MDQFMNLVTLGASGRVESAKQELERRYAVYQTEFTALERRREQVALMLEDLVATKQQAYRSLSRVRQVTKSLSPRERFFLGQEELAAGPRIDFGLVDSTIRFGEQAGALARGAGVGASTAAGAWALVGTFGSASTGAALSGLSGAAATNATLAFFGGGSLATGGAGMAGGAAVLGGIVLLPAVAVTGIFLHLRASHKIKEIESKATEIALATEACRYARVQLDAIESRANEVARTVRKSEAAFLHVLENTSSFLKLTTWWSRLIAWIRHKIFRRSYSKSQIQSIARLGHAATALAQLIDQPILNEDGSPT